MFSILLVYNEWNVISVFCGYCCQVVSRIIAQATVVLPSALSSIPNAVQQEIIRSIATICSTSKRKCLLQWKTHYSASASPRDKRVFGISSSDGSNASTDGTEDIATSSSSTSSSSSSSSSSSGAVWLAIVDEFRSLVLHESRNVIASIIDKAKLMQSAVMLTIEEQQEQQHGMPSYSSTEIGVACDDGSVMNSDSGSEVRTMTAAIDSEVEDKDNDVSVNFNNGGGDDADAVVLEDQDQHIVCIEHIEIFLASVLYSIQRVYLYIVGEVG